MLDKWRGYLREELQSPDGGIPVDEDGIRVASFGGKQALQRAMSLLLTIGKAVDEMHRMGVDWEDIHSGNIMRDHRGKLVIADIGWGLVHEEFEQKVSFLSVERAEQYKAPVPAAEAAEA
jgi:serine/threonine protein kinase